MAKAVRKILRAMGTRVPSKERMPSTKAISVAMGMPHPVTCGLSGLRATKISVGTIIPPTAATSGNSALLGEDNSPAMNSRFNSSPTTKKNIAMRPSLIQ
jgi:hypothetical protein